MGSPSARWRGSSFPSVRMKESDDRPGTMGRHPRVGSRRRATNGMGRMKVFVIMGNDYPAAVFSTEAAASAYVEMKKHEDPHYGMKYTSPRIYWRFYEFEID